MLGPFPRSMDRIDGGVAAAVSYLAHALVSEQGVDLIGVRITAGAGVSDDAGSLPWPVVDLTLGRGSVSTLFMRQRRRFSDLIQHFRPDLIHAQGADLAGLLAVRCQRPSVVTVHGVLAECARLQSSATARARDLLQSFLTERPTVRGARDLISISPYIDRYYRDEIRGRVHFIPNPVADAYFRVRREPESGRYLFAGRISRGKGVVDLIRAAGLAGRSVEKVVLAGSSPEKAYEASVRQEIRHLGLESKIEFAGLLDEPALLTEFGRAEALVLPSYQETAPMVVQQAMAAGLPVIATRVGGVPFQIEHDVSGLMFDPGDVVRLAALLLRVREDPALGVRLGEAARAVGCACFGAGTVARMTRAVYDRALSKAS